MRQEIDAASNFVSNLPADTSVSGGQRQLFRQTLARLMEDKFQKHWNVEQPLCGNGFRSIITCGGQFVDPLLTEAASVAGIDQPENLLPRDMVLWVDPFEVSYRIGDNGSVCVLFQTESKATTSPPATPVYHQQQQQQQQHRVYSNNSHQQYNQHYNYHKKQPQQQHYPYTNQNYHPHYTQQPQQQQNMFARVSPNKYAVQVV